MRRPSVVSPVGFALVWLGSGVRTETMHKDTGADHYFRAGSCPCDR